MIALLAIFNMRLGAWLGNPLRSTWNSPGPKNLLKYFSHELLGLTNAGHDYVYLSDGGHFENLGLYELLRRRCRFIVVCDSGADPDFVFEDLGGLIRKARIDFGIPIEIDVGRLKPIGDERLSRCHYAVGKIHYGYVDRSCTESDRHDPGDEFSVGSSQESEFHPENDEGLLIYLKPTITGDEPQDVLNYRAGHSPFPHEPTTDQWFCESQFESYRALGWHVARDIFQRAASELPADVQPGDEMREIFSLLYRNRFSS